MADDLLPPKRNWRGKKIDTAVLPDGRITTKFQTWRIQFGDEEKILKVTKEIFVHKKDLWQLLEDAAAPRHLFPSGYALEYQFPEAPFPIRVNIDDAEQLHRAYDVFSKEKKIFLTLRRNPLFDDRPPKTVPGKLKSRIALVRYLANLYATNNISLRHLDDAMAMKRSELRGTAFTAIPDHEKSDHRYLTMRRRRSSTTKAIRGSSLDDRFLNYDIDLPAYKDTKYPHLKAKRDRATATYPLPEAMFDCIICHKPSCANIRCMECDNYACGDCISSYFGHASHPFVLMHHLVCLKFPYDPYPSRRRRRRHHRQR